MKHFWREHLDVKRALESANRHYHVRGARQLQIVALFF